MSLFQDSFQILSLKDDIITVYDRPIYASSSTLECYRHGEAVVLEGSGKVFLNPISNFGSQYEFDEDTL